MEARIPNGKVEMIEYALNYAYSGNNKLKNYLSILVCVVSIMFLFPLIMIFGYLSKLRKSIIYEEPVPKFEDYGDIWEIGKKTFIVYLPLIFAFGFFLIIGWYFTLLIGFITIPIFVWPVVSMKFSEHMEIERVYDSEVIKIATSAKYVKYFSAYIFMSIYLMVAMIFLGSLTVGIGFILFFPIFLTFRTCYWAYAIRDIRSSIDD